jgi:hypothetical protein
MSRSKQKEPTMRIFFLLIVLGLGSPAAWAKSIKVPKGAIQVNQLHEELLNTFPAWRGISQTAGGFTDPLLRVESTDNEITLTMPDATQDAAVQAVIDAHKPNPKKDKAAEERIKKPSTLTLEERVKRLEILLGAE